MRASLVLIAPLILWTGLVGASLYPTKPVEKSVLRGGTWSNITWRDTEASPSLDELGKLRIDLWVDDSVSGCLALAHIRSVATPHAFSRGGGTPQEHVGFTSY